MFKKMVCSLTLMAVASTSALADDCGDSVLLGQGYVGTLYTIGCNYGQNGTRTITSYSPSCPAGSTYVTTYASEDIYVDIYDHAPIAGYSVQTGQSADGYGWVRVTKRASDDNGIVLSDWKVDGVSTSSSSLYYRNSKRRPMSHSVELKVVDSIGQVCNSNFTINVPSPTCGTRGSNQGCN
jgi:hypothetical protein